MNISDSITTLKAELAFNRTPSGRSITDYAAESLGATIQDKKNWFMDVMTCSNCSYINSSLQFPDGCPNCGGHDLNQ